MITIRNVDHHNAPRPSSDHIKIEVLSRGFQASGRSTVNFYVRDLSSTIYASYNDALREAKGWAAEFGIPEIFVVGYADGGRGNAV